MPNPVSRPVAVCTGCGAFTRSRAAIGQPCGASVGPRARWCGGVFLVVAPEDWRECRQCSGTGKNERVRCAQCQDTGWEHVVATTKVDLEARKLIKSLYEATDGRPLLWRTIIGLSANQAAVHYAVERGWIVVESGRSVCLTLKGVRLVRDASRRRGR
jgi:hypothetical protein